MASEPGTHAQFYYHERVMGAKSKAAGEEIKEPFLYVTIKHAGQEKSFISRQARDADKIRFAEEYQAFIDKENPPETGTPIDNLPAINPGQVQLLKRAHVHTIEDLVAVKDADISYLGPGIRGLRENAEKFLIDKGSHRIKSLEDENQSLHDRVGS